MKGFAGSGRVDSYIESLGDAEIVVGIPSYNNARTIGHVVRAVQAGFAKYFPDRKAVLVNSDGGSSDGTTDVVHEAAIDDFRSILLSHTINPFVKIATPYHGIPGKGSAFRTIFAIARRLNAKACAVVDSDLRSITPEWIELLIKPVLEGEFDYVAPLYQRHKYDGTITNSIVYPLTRALYGRRVRQPIGGDFGFSGDLAGLYLAQDVWATDVARYGIDVWMTTTAIAKGFRVCQAYLGAKIHDPKDPGTDLSTMLCQVVGATFDLLETYGHVWIDVKESQDVPTLGFHYDVGLEPVPVNVERMVERFRLGAETLGEFWGRILPAGIVDFVSGLARKDMGSFHFPDDVWSEIVYLFGLAYNHRVVHREHLLKSLTPLYVGRTASFIIDVADSDSSAVEEKIEGLCRSFEANKRLLLESWESRRG